MMGVSYLLVVIYSMLATIKLQISKMVVIWLGLMASNGIILLASESDAAVSSPGLEALKVIAPSFFSMLGLVLLGLINRKVNKVVQNVGAVAQKVDGLLEQKTLADKALGVIEGIDTAAKEKAIGDARELQVLKDQQLLNQTPPNRETKIDVKDEIVAEIKKVVTKSEDIQKAVDEVPDEVVKKLPPLESPPK